MMGNRLAAPASSRASVPTHVVQIAPRILGVVIKVHVSDNAIVQARDPLFSLDPTRVNAPHYGAVTNVLLAEGEFVSVGTPALTFIDAKDIWVTVDLRENQLRSVEPGDAAGLLFDACPARFIKGACKACPIWSQTIISTHPIAHQLIRVDHRRVRSRRIPHPRRTGRRR